MAIHLCLSTERQAGRSVSVDMGDESFYSYTFVTDKGIFDASVARGEDGKSPYCSVDRFETGASREDGIATGEPRFSGNDVEYISKALDIENVSKAILSR